MDYNKLIEYRKIVYLRIRELILRNDFSLKKEYLMMIHDYLFHDLLPEYGVIRKENLQKHEDILNGDSIIYPDYHDILSYLDYDFNQERMKNYKSFGMDKTVTSIASFTSHIWQTHPFMDGNTRSVSVFIYNYLVSMGYNIDHNIFKDNSLYLRNALVLANYYNYKYSIHVNKDAINKFFYKLLYDSSIVLDNDTLYVDKLFTNNVKILKK